jgi:type IV secretory pathway ATPase VirB11/archaellum biosynthesis ATPase
MTTVLQAVLKPLDKYLSLPNLLELNVNREQEVFLELVNDGYVQTKAPELDLPYWQRLCQVLANRDRIDFHPDRQPKVSTVLPGGHRFEGMVGVGAESRLSISIRMYRCIDYAFSSFGVDEKLEKIFIQAIEQDANIIISGGTSSGKTTFFNKLLRYIPKDKRVLSVEDTREIMVDLENQNNYLVSRNETDTAFSYTDAIEHLMRSRPDKILLGEISVKNAFPTIKLLNTGHGGFICTVHANTPELALTGAIPTNVQLSGFNPLGVADFLYKSIDLVVQLHRAGFKRQVTEILFPKINKTINVKKSAGYSWMDENSLVALCI